MERKGCTFMADAPKGKPSRKTRTSGKKPVGRTRWLPSGRMLSSAARIVGEQRAKTLGRHAANERAFLRAVLAEATARAPARLPERPATPDRYIAAADQLPFALLMIDADERFLYVNRAGEIMTGRSRHELVGLSVVEALAEGASGEESLAKKLCVVVRRARSGRQPVEYEISYTLPSGARFDVGFTASVVARPPQHREESDVVVVGRDLHMPGEGMKLRAESKLSAQVEADLRRRLRQAARQMSRSEKLVAIGQMAAGFVHEINNPLGALQGLVQLLQMDIDDDSPASEVLADVAGEIERIERIADSMLEIARSSAGEGAEGFAPVDVVENIESVLRVVTPQLKVKRVKAVREFAVDEAWVLGDADRLRQVLMNLILNASQAMSPEGTHPPPGGRVAIRLAEDTAGPDDMPERPSRAEDLAAAGAEADVSVIGREALKRSATDTAPPWRDGMRLVRLEVEDTGLGIPEDILGRVFEPFFTTKPQGEGTGLGLSTSEAVVRAHGGTIRAENVPGGGARFTIRLPACEAPAP
jgi:PAS domain S-box-containing protein